jgi:hypothetical protein
MTFLVYHSSAFHPSTQRRVSNCAKKEVPVQAASQQPVDFKTVLASSPWRGELEGKAVLTDKFARHHTYLRISLTEKCNLRCLVSWCLVSASKTQRVLSVLHARRRSGADSKGLTLVVCRNREGFVIPACGCSLRLGTVQVARLFVEAGVTKIRFTGGEPTVRVRSRLTLSTCCCSVCLPQIRPDIEQIFEEIGKLQSIGLTTMAMTSNGQRCHCDHESPLSVFLRHCARAQALKPCQVRLERCQHLAGHRGYGSAPGCLSNH